MCSRRKQVDGKWYIEIEEVNSQIEQVESQVEQQENQLVARLESEVEYLRDQLDKQTQLLAAATKHNADLIKQLPPPRRSSMINEWVRRQIAKFPQDTLKGE